MSRVLFCFTVAAIFMNNASAQDRLRVGVWNIERLSATADRGFPELRGDDQLPPRTDADLQQMAAYIRDELKVDALMISEIEADSPMSTEQKPQSAQLNRVALEMGSNWKYFLGRTGGDMRLGLLFNTDRVQLKKLVNLDAPKFPVSGKDVLDRDPFIAWIAARDQGETKNDVLLVCMHLKSQQGPFKDNRMAAIAKLIGDYKHPKTRELLTLPSPNEEPEVLILGDFNDSSFKSNGFRYLFDYLKGVEFTHIRNNGPNYPHTRVNGSQIDHIFGSKKIIRDSMVSSSFKVHTVPGDDDQPLRMTYRKSLSDHFPVTVDLKLQDDNDFTIREAMATADAGLRQRRMAALQDEAFERAARAMPTPATANQQDDEEVEEVLLEFDVRDDNFEEILAPSAPSIASNELAVDVGVSVPFAGVESAAIAASVPGTQLENLATPTPQGRFARSDLPVVFLQQNWTPAEAVEFYSLRQGSPLMRRDFFNALEQPDSNILFRDSDYLSSFGFLPRHPHDGNEDGYPVGFTGGEAIELTCAACHTSKLTYDGKEYWIDGSQAMTDMESWLKELVRAIRLTEEDAPVVLRDDTQFEALGGNQQLPLSQDSKFGRFVFRLTGSANPSAAQAKVIYDLLAKELARRQRYNDYNDFGREIVDAADRNSATGHIRYGFSRLDALGAILNQACAEHIGEGSNAAKADAPVNYPAIWDAPQHRHVQWNGAVDNEARFGPLGRNAGQVIGVFGLVDTDGAFGGYDSSINFDSIQRAEDLVTKLWSPEWVEAFGDIDQAMAAAGRVVYRDNCIDCHSLIERTDPERRANDVLVPIESPLGQYPALGTDVLAAKNFNDRQAKVGLLAGRLESLPFQGRFPDDPDAEVPARDILSHVIFRAISRSFVPWRAELTIDDEHAHRAMAFSANTNIDTLMRYKSRPLNGVWSTAPYLHNGSVLNMVELLTPPADRKTKFRLGTTNFDPTQLGYVDEGPYELDTSLPGNSNQGHAYGTDLSAEEKAQLIEYLKTL